MTSPVAEIRIGQDIDGTWTLVDSGVQAGPLLRCYPREDFRVEHYGPTPRVLADYQALTSRVQSLVLCVQDVEASRAQP